MRQPAVSPRGFKRAVTEDIAPIYLDTHYNLYPDSPVAEETLQVIGAAMAETGIVELGRLGLSRREWMVAVERRGQRGAARCRRPPGDAVRSVASRGMRRRDGRDRSRDQRTGSFDRTAYRDRYQAALRELIKPR